MQTNNTTPISTVYTVITYAVFGTIQTTVAFYSKEDAEKNVIDWANDNSYKGAAFTSADEAINWFVDADEDIEVSIRLEETYVYGNKTYYDDDLEMLTSENKFMGEFLSKLGYSQDEVSEIANTGMLETPKNDEITTVVKLKNGILDEAKSFVSHKDAEAFFQEEFVKLEPSLSKEDIEACLDNGYWDNNSGDDIFITQNDLVGIGSNNVSCESNEVLEPECQIKHKGYAPQVIYDLLNIVNIDVSWSQREELHNLNVKLMQYGYIASIVETDEYYCDDGDEEIEEDYSCYGDMMFDGNITHIDSHTTDSVTGRYCNLDSVWEELEYQIEIMIAEKGIDASLNMQTKGK